MNKSSGDRFITTSVVSVKINKSPKALELLRNACFSSEKEKPVFHYPAQRIAGLAACKKAIAKVIREMFGATIRAKSIVLTHRTAASPKIASLPKEFAPLEKDFCISLSHTKTHAFGCAVLTIQGDDGE